jgi:hypothetical protein
MLWAVPKLSHMSDDSTGPPLTPEQKEYMGYGFLGGVITGAFLFGMLAMALRSCGSSLF